jgi:DNA polymerase-3 subunit alpha
VHLHRHSEWSLGDGTGTAEQYAEQAVELGQPALAITDHGSLAGTLYHMQACEKAGIKPLLGMEAYYRPDVSKDREEKKQYGYYHLVLLAKNEIGWKNLMKLSSQSHDDAHFYQKPSVDWSLLKAHSEGLIATSSCLAGYIPQALLNSDYDAVEQHLIDMRGLFGDRYYIEIQPHDLADQITVNSRLADLANAKGIPMVATADVHAPFKDWTETQKLRVLIGQNKTIAQQSVDADGKEYGGIPTTYLMSADELRDSFAAQKALMPGEVEKAIECSLEIADRCEHIVIDKTPKIPKATSSLMEAEVILRKWCEEGLERTGKKHNDLYRDRVDHELKVMRKLKMFDYFIIMGDAIRWAKSEEPLPSVKLLDPHAKKKPIRVGPGRGSAGGSLVCYLSRITAMDPIGYNLLFERFLNEYRTEIPDVDIDLQHDRRHEVITYLIEKWGPDYVIDVAAFQSFGLKAAVQDVARVLGISYPETKKATDVIPKITYGESLESMEQQYPVLHAYFEKHPDVATHAKRLQGQIKGSSKHPAAVIITNVPAEEVIPLMRSKDGSVVTQWSERANAQLLSPYGFLKYDFLVTDALTSQAQSIELIRERHGKLIDFEDAKQFSVVESPENSEREVIETFAHGRNLGVFQFASRGISGLLKEIKPDSLDHIIAANALYRPGTLSNGMAFEYAERKNGKHWDLPHEAVEPFLAKTFGIMVFQEQVMQMYRALGKDVESSESAVFLKVVAKGIARDVKGKEKLKPYYSKFAAGCKEKGIPKSAYDELWQQILQMTTYAFNRSHSGGYALQAYFDAWLKFHYPLEFYAPLLSTEEDKTPQIIRESRAYGLKILPPDINQSNAEFTVDGNAIRFGLLAVKGVAWAGLQEIQTKRPFQSYEDFDARIDKRRCNKTAKAALLEAGAFDTLGGRSDWLMKDKTDAEKKHLGIALSSADDVVKHKKLLAEYITPPDKYHVFSELNETVNVGGEIIKLTDHKTKKGDPYTRVDVEFDGDETSVVFWKETYGKYRHMLAEGGAVLIAGHYDVEYENVSATACITAEQLAMEQKEKK